MIFDKKKSVSVILSKLGKDGKTTETDIAHETGEHNEYTALAEDIIAHVKTGSVQGLASCLESFHEMIKEKDEEQDQEG
jgi:hypothetical protein